MKYAKDLEVQHVKGSYYQLSNGDIIDLSVVVKVGKLTTPDWATVRDGVLDLTLSSLFGKVITQRFELDFSKIPKEVQGAEMLEEHVAGFRAGVEAYRMSLVNLMVESL